MADIHLWIMTSNKPSLGTQSSKDFFFFTEVNTNGRKGTVGGMATVSAHFFSLVFGILFAEPFLISTKTFESSPVPYY